MWVGSVDGYLSIACSRASPRLKDAQLPSAECAGLYQQLVLVVRTMFQTCKLVHADLSEYNIIYHQGNLWIIDVSQSVEHDHPSAFDFLRNDIKNVEDFFGRLGVKCLGLRRCFEFVTRDRFSQEEGLDDTDVLKSWLEKEESSLDDDALAHQDSRPGRSSLHEDSVFLRSFIPRTLNEVYDPESDVEKLKRGEGRSLIYAKTIGVVPSSDIDGVKTIEEDERSCSDSDGSEDVGDRGGDDGEETDGEEGFVERKPRGHRHEDKDAKKVKLVEKVTEHRH